MSIRKGLHLGLWCMALLLPAVIWSQPILDSLSFNLSRQNAIEKANNYMLMADSLFSISLPDSAVLFAQKAAAIYDQQNQKDKFYTTYYQIAYNLYGYNDYDKIIQLLLPILPSLGSTIPRTDATPLANTYSILASAHRQKGEYNQAIPYYQEALSLLQQTNNNASINFDLAPIFYNLGLSYFSNNNFELSLWYNQKALNLQLQQYREGHPLVAATYKNIGLLQTKLGNYNQALDAYQRSLQILLQIDPEHRQLGELYTNLSSVYIKKNMQQEAIATSELALANLKEYYEEEHPNFADNYNNIGDAYLQLEQFEQAIPYYQKALSNRQATLNEKHPYIAESYIKLGIAARNMHNFEQAMTNFSQAEQLLIDSNRNHAPFAAFNTNRPYLIEVWAEQALTYRYGYDEQHNISLLENALHTYEKIFEELKYNTQILDPQSYKNYNRQEIRQLFSYAINIAYQLYTQSPTPAQQQYAEKALQLADLHNLLSFRHTIQQATPVINFGLPDSLMQHLQHLSTAYNYHEFVYYNKTQNPDVSPQILEDLKDKLNTIQQEQQTLILQIKEKYPKYYTLVQDTSIALQIKSVQRQLLTYNSHALRYFTADTATYALSISPKTIQFYQLPPPSIIRKASDSLYNTLTDHELLLTQPQIAHDLYTQIGYSAYQTIAQIPLRHLPNDVKRLVIVPDENLYNLPFEAMLESPATANTSYQNMNFLLKKYAISYADNLVFWLNDQQISRQRYRNKLLVYAPTYNREQLASSDDELAGELARTPQSALQKQQQQLIKIAQKLRGNLQMNEKASADNWYKSANKANIVHVGDHTSFHHLRPTESKILCSNIVESKTPPQITLKQIYEHKAIANMVSLAHTHHYSDSTNFKSSLFYFAEAFSFSGCPTLNAAIWEVNSLIEADLWLYFYQILQKKQPVDLALQQAKLALLYNNQNNVKSHPYFWASILTVGNMQPVFSIPLALILLGISLCVGITFGIWKLYQLTQFSFFRKDTKTSEIST